MRLLLIMICLLSAVNANAADVVRYINTDSTSGGDGTTNATTGVNRAYATMAEWATAEATDLAAATDTHTVYCDGATEDTSDVDLSGWTCSATYPLKILGNTSNRHNGTWSTSAYRLTRNNDTTLVVPTSCDGIEIGWIQLKLTGTFSRQVLDITGSSQSIHHCLIHFAATPAGGSDALEVNGSTTDSYVYNNIIWNTGTGDDGVIAVGVGYNCRVYNNTCYGFTKAFTTAFGTIDARNNLAHATTTGFSGTFAGTSTNNASNQNDAPGANAVNGTATYVNAPTDLHLDAADTTAKDAGTDLSAATPSITDDIDGESRSGTYDIGADEVVASSGPAINPISSSIPGSSLDPIRTTIP